MGRIARKISLTRGERYTLERLREESHRRSEPFPDWRAGVASAVLKMAEGKPSKQIAQELDYSEKTICFYRRQFFERGIEFLTQPNPLGGRPSNRVARNALMAWLTLPPTSGRYWTVNQLAYELGVETSTAVSPAWIRRTLKKEGIQLRKIRSD